MKFLKFNEWLKEDFAQVGIAPEGNMVGMGNPVAPTTNSTGSGDAWPSLFTPFSLVPLQKRKRRRKRKKNGNR